MRWQIAAGTVRPVAWMLRCSGQQEGVMSRTAVGLAVERLLTEEDLRVRFALAPMETVAEMCLLGVDLTRDEIELLCRSDAGLWFLKSALMTARQH
jgi:hypothetical protein